MSETEPAEPRSISEVIKALIEENTRPLKHIARDAKVDYQALRRWTLGLSHSYDVDDASKVYLVLTGKSFSA